MNRFVTTIVCALVASPAHAQIVASTGFNNLSGINSTTTANSPYNVKNVSVVGQGAGEPGWNSTWQGGGNLENVVNNNTFEGDGALFLQGSASQVFRTLSAPLAGTETMTFEVKILSTAGVGVGGNDFYLMDGKISDQGLRVAAQADPGPNGDWFVLDGSGNGVGSNVDTGIPWTPGVYQQLRFDVNGRRAIGISSSTASTIIRATTWGSVGRLIRLTR